jgi:hypothetical protein
MNKRLKPLAPRKRQGFDSILRRPFGKTASISCGMTPTDFQSSPRMPLWAASQTRAASLCAKQWVHRHSGQVLWGETRHPELFWPRSTRYGFRNDSTVNFLWHEAALLRQHVALAFPVSRSYASYAKDLNVVLQTMASESSVNGTDKNFLGAHLSSGEYWNCQKKTGIITDQDYYRGVAVPPLSSFGQPECPSEELPSCLTVGVWVRPPWL